MSWTDKLNGLIAESAYRQKKTQAFYQKYKGLLDKYSGGMPVGFMSSVAIFESGGTMSAGDPNLGEYGFFQIAESTPGKFGLPASLRTTAEGNIYVAGLEYNAEAKRLALKYPALFIEGTADNWMVARLVFAVGRSGTDKLITSSSPTRGNVYNSIKNFVNKTGGIALGGQDASKVWFRVRAIEVLYQQGLAAVPTMPAIPQEIPHMAGHPYRMPSDVRGTFRTPSNLNPIAAAIIIGALYFLG